MKQLFHTRVWTVRHISGMLLGMRPTRRDKEAAVFTWAEMSQVNKAWRKPGIRTTCQRGRDEEPVGAPGGGVMGVEGNSHSSSKEAGQTVFRSIFSTFVCNHTSVCVDVAPSGWNIWILQFSTHLVKPPPCCLGTISVELLLRSWGCLSCWLIKSTALCHRG